MKLFNAHRLGKHILYYMLCAAMLTGLARIGHAQAQPLQNDGQVSAATRQPITMTACLPCASCHAAPPSVASISGSGDHPALVSVDAATRFAEQTNSYVLVPGISARPALPLRIVYCRWLN